MRSERHFLRPIAKHRIRHAGVRRWLTRLSTLRHYRRNLGGL